MITKLCPHPQAATQGKCCLLMLQKFLTLQPDIFKIICILSNWAQERAWM